ncbi:hypothetical protein [uncultured Dokdonia sp.]|uniref:hypothetical protein n=1 Tax=uncultured Dokdonia sp. TaxID=575653 RepID=UPI00263832CC|nr:hypothetical protein [uncultured Dokdonia sp.]
MEHSNSEIIEKQRIVFITFMQDVVRTYRKNTREKRKVVDYSRNDVTNLRADINKYLEKHKSVDEDKAKTIGFTTLLGYVEICQHEHKELKYREYILNSCAKYIDIEPKYRDFRHYVERSKDRLRLSGYSTNHLIYPYKKPDDTINKELKSFDYKEMSYELLSTLDKNQIDRYIKFYLKEVDDIKSNDKANFWLGVLLLCKRQYYLVIKRLEKCIDLNPIDEEYHYNLALAKFKGRIPFILKSKEIESIGVDIMNAINLNPDKRKFYELQYIIQEEFYKKRSLRPHYDEISLAYIDTFDQDEIERNRLLDALNIIDFFN